MAVKLPAWRMVAGSSDSASAGGTGIPYEEVPIGTLDGSNTVFTTTFVPAYGFLQLFINGVHNNKFIPQFSLSGNTIQFSTAPKSTDQLYCWYFKGAAAGPSPGTARGFGSLGSSSTDVLNWGNNSRYQLPGDVTFAGWVKFHTSPGIVIEQGTDGGGGSTSNDLFTVNGSASGSNFAVGWRHEHGSQSPVTHSFAYQFTPDVWYFIALVRDATAKTVKLYVGLSGGSAVALQESWTFATNADGGTGAATALTVGNSQPAGGNCFNGGIQQHYLWGRTLTQDECTGAMNGIPSQTGLLLACAMGKTPEVDTSGNGASGTVTGTVLIQGH